MIAVFLIAVVLALFFSTYIQYHWSKRRLYALSWSLDGPIPLPFIGDALHLMCKDEDLLNAITKLFYTYKSPIKVWLGPKLVVVFTEMTQVEKIMSSMKFANKDEVYKFLYPFDGASLISGSGRKWRTDRRTLTPIFSQKRVEQYMPICVEQANILVDKLKNRIGSGYFDVETYFHRLAGGLVSEMLLGIKTNAQDGEIDYFLKAISNGYILVHKRISKAWLHNEWIYQLFYGSYQRGLQKTIHGYLQEHVNNAIKRRQENSHQVGCVLDDFLDIKDNVPDFATDLEFIHHLTTFYTASEDTITIVCSFAILLLGKYPEIQARVFQEIQEVLGPEPRNVELEDLPKFKYLSMCIKDVMRLFPIAPFIMREASEDVLIDKWTIPKKCSVLVSIYNIHRSLDHWEKPSEFYPEHFLPEAVTKRHPYAFMPFSAGPRGCIGKSFAYMAIRTILATVLQYYQVEAEGTLQSLKIKTDITIRSKEGYSIRIKERK